MIHRTAGGCHASGHSTSVVQRPTARKEAGSLAPPQVTIELCGHLAVSVDGRRCESDLPGRQGRLALAHLALNRTRAVTRERLIAALWGEDAPAGALAGAQRRAVQAAARARPRRDRERRRAGRAARARRARRPRRARSRRSTPRSRRATARDWPAVVEAAGRVAALADAGLLPGYEAPWLEDPRRRLEELGLQARELRGDAGLAVGGAELAPRRAGRAGAGRAGAVPRERLPAADARARGAGQPGRGAARARASCARCCATSSASRPGRRSRPSSSGC